MTTTPSTFDLTREQAESYEASFGPVLFGEWAPLLVDAAGLEAGASVLDVACGTGVVARAAATRVGDHGRVVGVDRSQAMVDVAAGLLPTAEFRVADAEQLPFDDASFDAVLCQAALMFFPNPGAAVAEMARVVKDEGTVGLQVWGRLESSIGYLPFVEVAARHAGPEAIGLLSTYFVHGDLDRLTGLFNAAGLEVTATTTRLGAMRFGSIDEFVTSEVESTPLHGLIDDDTYEAIRADAQKALGGFRTEAGVAVPIEGHIVVARRAP